MSDDISQFLGRFERGLSRPTRYRVEFKLPSGIVRSTVQDTSVQPNRYAEVSQIQIMDSTLNTNGMINILCHSASLPQRSLMTYDHKQWGAPFRVPYTQSYDPVTFSFYADSTMNTRKYFELWQSAVVCVASNALNFYSEYVADVKIFMLNTMNEDTYYVTLYEAFPLNIGMVDLSYASASNFSTITVTLSFKDWEAYEVQGERVTDLDTVRLPSGGDWWK